MVSPATFSSPFVIIIYGATGDLARHKLLPALFSLYKKQKLPEKFFIVGFARREFSDDDFRELIGKTMRLEKDVNANAWKNFKKNLFYQQGTFEETTGYEALIKKLNTFDTTIGACITRIFYLATPPDNYEIILENLKITKLSEGCGQGSDKWTKLAIEKPFGKDLATARQLDQKLAEVFEERQIFRVDHYLGKDTVQNMLAFRFANSIFEPVWNTQYIDHVQITVSEKNDVSTRGRFFDGVGNLRDWGQNHLMQLATAMAIEQPRTFSKEGVRDARAAAIKSLRLINPDEVGTYVVRGQYEGYRETKNVDPHSDTETFVAMKMFFDTKRFNEVPFYVRAGKNMEKDLLEIHVVFRQTCHILFKEYGCPEIGNVLTFRIQPESQEGIGLQVIAKSPGTHVALSTVNMTFSYQQEFGRLGTDAYEKLLLDILSGDQMLFNRSDELESSWEYITSILNGWEKERRSKKWKIPTYKPGSWGPKESVRLIEKDGRKWL